MRGHSTAPGLASDLDRDSAESRLDLLIGTLKTEGSKRIIRVVSLFWPDKGQWKWAYSCALNYY